MLTSSNFSFCFVIFFLACRMFRTSEPICVQEFNSLQLTTRLLRIPRIATSIWMVGWRPQRRQPVLRRHRRRGSRWRPVATNQPLNEFESSSRWRAPRLDLAGGGFFLAPSTNSIFHRTRRWIFRCRDLLNQSTAVFFYAWKIFVPSTLWSWSVNLKMNSD